MAQLEGKTALVTGAARGIGAAIARAFTNEGARVFITDVRDEIGTAFAATLQGGEYIHLDVREEAEWERAMARIPGRLDIVVNNAGIIGVEGGAAHDPEHASLKDWHAVHRINLDGVFLGCRYAIRAMRPHKAGSIINMSSRAGLVGIPTAAAYASSKAAVRNHTKSVALYCAQQGLNIRCNSIHPGSVLTPIWDPVLGFGPDRNERSDQVASGAPLGRWGMPEEIAAVAVFLASDQATFMTGAEMVIDGGVTAGPPTNAGVRS